MQDARIRWGEADLIEGRRRSTEVSKNAPEEGGPVHRMLLEKHRKKMARRAKRYFRASA